MNYNSYVRRKLEYMPIRRLAEKIGASPLTIARWRDGKPISWKYREKLKEMAIEDNEEFNRALTRDLDQSEQ